MGSEQVPAADLGDLPFSLSAEQLRRIGGARISTAEAEVGRILSDPDPPTASSFLGPLDRLMLSVRDVSAHGGLVFSVHPDAAVRDAGRSVSEAADRFFNALRVNERVYAALARVPEAELDGPGRFALSKLRREMRRSGVEKSGPVRAELLALTNEIDRVSNEFTENIARARRSIEVDGPGELAGLPDDYRRAHPAGSDGRVRLTTDYPDFRPVMTYAEVEEVRRRLLAEFANRAHPENGVVLARLLKLRHEFARLLGYPSYADFALEDKMIGTPPNAEAFLARVAASVRPAAEADLAKLLERKRRDHPRATRLEGWDIGLFAEGFYEAKLRSERFGLDVKQLRAYLPYPQVRDGLFALCGSLFQLDFHRVQEDRAWHPSVEVYDVRRDGAMVGRFYLDLVPREGKYGHAACFTVREGLAGIQLPQSALVCNFLDPGTPSDSARLEYSDVVTFFHEFGHLLHALLSGHGRWLYNSPGQVEWDFVEAPSQLFEEWARDPATLRRFARDPDTAAPIPDELLERLRASEAFGRPGRWIRQVALSESSLQLYGGDPGAFDPHARMLEAYSRYAVAPFDPAYHPEESWGHLTGYSAFYYTYVWSVVIARDLLTPFRERRDLTDPTIARRYAKEILAAGSERPAAELVEAFLGRPFDERAFQRWVSEAPRPVGSLPTGHADRS